jgi:hypothetical protein
MLAGSKSHKCELWVASLPFGRLSGTTAPVSMPKGYRTVRGPQIKDEICAKAGLSLLRCPHGLRLGAVHPHLPATGLRSVLVEEAIGPAAAELRAAEVPDATEHAGDPPARPGERVFDLRERAWVIRRGGKRAQELAYQVAAAVVETLDLVGIIHRVLSRVLGGGERGGRS